MRPITTLILTILATASLAVAQNSILQCAKGLQLFIARGTNEPKGPGEMGKLGQRIIKKIKSSQFKALDYPASFDKPVPYFYSVGNGTEALRKDILSYKKACPKSKIAVFGYSQGAQVVTNNFCGAKEKWGEIDPLQKDYVESNVVAVVVFGDPTRQGNATYNEGSAGHDNHGVFFTGNRTCDYVKDRLVSYCDKGDVICDAGKDTDETVHGKYMTSHGDDAFEFVVKKYESLSNPNSTTTTSAVSSTAEATATGSATGGSSTAGPTGTATTTTGAATPSAGAADSLAPELSMAVGAFVLVFGLM